MAQNLTKLASQGRAYDPSRPWTEEELAALLTLERECSLTRQVAASFVRNGIKTVKAYEASKKAGFVPKSLEDLRAEAIAAYTEKVRSDLGLEVEVVEPEEVVEPKEVVEPEAAVVAEEVIEPAEVIEPEEVVEPTVQKASKNKSGK